MMAGKPEQVAISLPSLNLQILQLTLIGDSPLICHAWSQKAKLEMLNKQMKRAKEAKEAKNPEQDFKDSLYPYPDGGFGFPTIAFKASAVSAARFTDGLKMTVLRGAFHLPGELVKIDGEPTPREDMVRLGGMTADIRFRGEFKEWRATVTVQHNAAVISSEQIAHLFNQGGFGCGVGEWRPEKNGPYGRFHVATDKEARS